MSGEVFGRVAIGGYLSRTDGNVMSATSLALAENPYARRFVLPAGDHLVTHALTEASGLRNDLAFDGHGVCRLYRTTPGQGFLWVNPAPQNITFRGITFDIVDTITNHRAMVNISEGINIAVENCFFDCSFPNATADGIYHAMNLLGGRNLVCRNNRFRGVQAVLCGLGRSAINVLCTDNLFEDCNDLGVSCVAGNSPGLVLRNIQITNNVFRDCHGAGYVYVGGDGTTDQADLSDILIVDNVGSGTLRTQLVSGQRAAIQVSWGLRNDRIRVTGNQVSTDNPTANAPLTYGIRAFSREGVMEYARDVEISDNSVDFRSNDTQTAIECSGVGISGVRVRRNYCAPGSRGLALSNCSLTEVSDNQILGATSAAIVATATAPVTDFHVRRNHIETVGVAKAGVQFSGASTFARTSIVDNRILAAYSVIDVSGGATFRYRDNTTTAALHESAVPAGGEIGTIAE